MKRNAEAAILDNELRNTQHSKLEKSSIEESLFAAIDNNDIALFNSIITQHYKVDQTDQFDRVDLDSIRNTAGYTLIHHAASKGSASIVEQLIGYGADKEARTEDKFKATPLHTAAWHGHTEVVKLLLENGANVNVVDDGNWSPLHDAAMHGSTEIVDLLLKNGAIIDAVGGGDCSPLHDAAQEGHTEVVKLLLENGANVNVVDDGNWSPLHAAAANGNTEVVELLLKNNANIEVADNDNWSPLHAAAMHGHTEIVELLLNNGANVDVVDNNNRSPLYGAAYYGHTEIVKLLLENNANIEVADNNKYNYGNALLDSIMSIRPYHKVDQTAQFDEENCSPLNAAAQQGHTEVVELLLKNGANINVLNKNNYSPLHAAAAHGRTEIVELLLNNGANVDVVGNHNWSPLYVAAMYGRTEIVKLLLENNANINVLDKKNYSPLYAAAQNRHTEVVELLLKNGADTKSCNDLINNPYIYVHDATIENLLKIGQVAQQMLQLQNIEITAEIQKLLLEHKEMVVNIFKSRLIKEGMPSDSYNSYYDRINQKYLSPLLDSIENTPSSSELQDSIKNIQSMFKVIIMGRDDDIKSHAFALADFEGQLLATEGVEPADFVLGTVLNQPRSNFVGIDADNTFTRLMQTHPEYKNLGTVLETLLKQNHFNGLNEVQYRILKCPAAKEALDRLNSIVLPRSLKKVVAKILQDHQKICGDDIIHNLLVLEENLQQAKTMHTKEIASLQAQLQTQLQTQQKESVAQTSKINKLESFIEFIIKSGIIPPEQVKAFTDNSILDNNQASSMGASTSITQDIYVNGAYSTDFDSNDSQLTGLFDFNQQGS